MESPELLASPGAFSVAELLLTPANIATALIAINFITFAAFAIDPL